MSKENKEVKETVDKQVDTKKVITPGGNPDKPKKKVLEKEQTIKKSFTPEILGYLGPARLKVTKLCDKEVNGVDYKEIHTMDGQTFLLNEHDLKKQMSK